MVRFVNRTIHEFNPEQRDRLTKVVAALSAEAKLPSQLQQDRQDRSIIEEGRLLVASDEMRCTECHQFRKRDEEATAPDLTGYGSTEWLTAIIKDPAHERFYGKRNDRMPSFGADNRLDEKSLAMIVTWLRGETSTR